MLHIYGYKGCHYCELAQELLTAKGIPFNYYDIKSPQQKDKLDFVRDQGFQTVPQVYEEERHIGGYTELFSEVMKGTVSK